ncbi:MAG: carboxymuconolactone decarboxylase family protein [Pseudonocardiaceae bacterium]
MAPIDKRFPHAIIEYVFGEFVSRPELDLRSRQLATVAVLTAIGGCEPQLETHIRATMRADASQKEIIALIIHVTPYAGVPHVINGLNVPSGCCWSRPLVRRPVLPGQVRLVLA